MSQQNQDILNNLQNHSANLKNILIQVLHQINYVNTMKLLSITTRLSQLILNLIKHESIRLGFRYQLIFVCVVTKFQKYEGAMECYQKAILINPKDDSAWSKKELHQNSITNILIHILKKQKEL
ncbi:unnamed protein product [Paramecium primaurelia]|uniref:Tetratricopeptide repeat protein n=1 Tax=Paramecium primaurelia TaxID=5886 RepID=A0A8S1NBM2_PARPR|nr:unnamed protein product [Paramecium primaurelia]